MIFSLKSVGDYEALFALEVVLIVVSVMEFVKYGLESAS